MSLSSISAVKFSALQNNFKNLIGYKSKKSSLNQLSEDMFIPTVKKEGIIFPWFSAGKKINYEEIVKFHKDIEKKENRDKLSYEFYTSINDIGSGFKILALPISRTDDKAHDEMIKEIKRLISPESNLSFDEKIMLKYLYQHEPQIRFKERE